MASHCPPNDFMCKTGDLLLPRPVLRFLETYIIGNDRSLVYISFWSVFHLGMGVVTARYITDSYWNGLLIHSLAELYQIVVKNTPIETLRGKLDVVMDTVFFMTGMFLARYI